MPQEYGMLIYDVPTKNKKLYMRLWKAVRKQGIRLNLSVYLVKWGQKESIQEIIDEAIAETGQRALVRFQRFHPEDKESTENWAVECLQRDIKEIIHRLHTRITQATKEDANDIRPEFFNKLKKELANFETLAIMFGFEGDIQGVMNTTRGAVERIWQAHLEA